MTSIATRTGDDGNTSLFGGSRVAKDNARVEAYGNVDELNCWIGLVRAGRLEPGCDRVLVQVQNQLFQLGAELATRREGNPNAAKIAPFGDAPLGVLDRAVDEIEAALPRLDAFILPGGSPAAAALHVARAVCRRAERSVVTLAHEERIPAAAIRYLNRLSDVLFLMARRQNAHDGGTEVSWRP
jgi:cob(I)alamin adenosyltransferase